MEECLTAKGNHISFVALFLFLLFVVGLRWQQHFGFPPCVELWWELLSCYEKSCRG